MVHKTVFYFFAARKLTGHLNRLLKLQHGPLLTPSPGPHRTVARLCLPSANLALTDPLNRRRGLNSIFEDPGAVRRTPAGSVPYSYIGTLPQTRQSERCRTSSSSQVERLFASICRQGAHILFRKPRKRHHRPGPGREMYRNASCTST